MARTKKFRPELDQRSIEFLTKIHEELVARGSTKHNISDLIFLLLSSAKPSLINDFVSEHTPVEFKLKLLLENPKENSKVLEMINRKTFGITKEVIEIPLES